MKSGIHLSIMRQLFIESGEINDRIVAGDICSARTGLPRARKLCDHYARIMQANNALDVKIEPYVAAGGWIGITYSFTAGVEPFCGSVVTRTLS